MEAPGLLGNLFISLGLPAAVVWCAIFRQAQLKQYWREHRLISFGIIGVWAYELVILGVKLFLIVGLEKSGVC